MNGYEDFRKRFGRGEPYRSWRAEDADRLSDRIPPVMRDIVAEDGWCSYADGLLWLCDPDDWTVTVDLYVDIVPDAALIARTAFGDLFLWDGQVFWFLMVHEALAMRTMDDADWFFSGIITKRDFLPGPFEQALGRCGPLNWDEMYSYVPALALGGSGDFSTIEKVKAKEGLAILAQLEPVRRV